jgi:hypothetical protein
MRDHTFGHFIGDWMPIPNESRNAATNLLPRARGKYQNRHMRMHVGTFRFIMNDYMDDINYIYNHNWMLLIMLYNNNI